MGKKRRNREISIIYIYIYIYIYMQIIRIYETGMFRGIADLQARIV